MIFPSRRPFEIINNVASRKECKLFSSYEEGTEVGVFFRSPFYKFSFEQDLSRVQSVLNFFRLRKFYNSDADRVYLRGLRSPLYFKRAYRKLTASLFESGCLVLTHESYGFNQMMEKCAGACDYERTVITNEKTGVRSVQVNNSSSYYWTYYLKVRDVYLGRA